MITIPGNSRADPFYFSMKVTFLTTVFNYIANLHIVGSDITTITYVFGVKRSINAANSLFL